jgi:hypothetical protein
MAAARAGAPVGAPEETSRKTIGEVFYPGAMRGGGRLEVSEDESVVVEAVAPAEETWTGLREHLGRIPAERAAQVKGEVLARLAAQEPRASQTGTTVLAKYIQTFSLTSADVNFKGEHGVTALMQASVNDREAHVRDLLIAGADPNVQNDMGETALMWAAAYGAMSPVRVFREQRDVVQPIAVNFDLTDNLGWNALMVAAWCGNYAAVNQLTRRTSRTHRDLAGRSVVEIARDPASPATLRVTPQDNVLEKVLLYLSSGQHTGGRKRTYRSKTKDKKRGTR